MVVMVVMMADGERELKPGTRSARSSGRHAANHPLRVRGGGALGTIFSLPRAQRSRAQLQWEMFASMARRGGGRIL